MDQFDRILNRLNRLEIVSTEREAGLLFDANRYVDGIDAVEIEVIDQAGIGAKILGAEVELANENFDHPFEDFTFGLHPVDPWRSKFAGTEGRALIPQDIAIFSRRSHAAPR